VIVIGGLALILLATAVFLVRPRLHASTAPSTPVRAQARGSGAANASGSGSTTAKHSTEPFYQWDYVWGINHPAVGAPRTQAKAELLVDLESREVLYARAPQQHMPLASITKLVTAMVTLDHASTDTVVTVPAAATKIEPDSMGVSPGEKLTVGDLLYGLLLDSGNDAAETLAMTIMGHDAFIQAMNDKAAQLGLADTRLTNPSGLDDASQYSSAQDLAIVAGYIYQYYPRLEQVMTTRDQVIPGGPDHKAFYPENYNKMLWSYPGVIGFKTGLTDDAGTCLVTGAHRGNRTLLLVELNDPVIFTDATNMLNYGFSRPA
jgi:D-alanyl-D-alanine carboxypeptidase (penicillin-binding protein 5/6)